MKNRGIKLRSWLKTYWVSGNKSSRFVQPLECRLYLGKLLLKSMMFQTHRVTEVSRATISD
jgi:hypothetical protein